MTLPIHEVGGLTDAEIQLRIEEAQERTVGTLEQKLKQHTDEINQRLATTDQAVREVASQYAELKADVAVLVASDSQQTSLLKEIVAKGDEWHEQDINFRTMLIQRVSKIETEQEHLSKQMRLLRWMAALSSSTAKVFAYVMGTENFRFFVVAALVLFALHLFAPHLVPLVEHWIASLK